MDYIISEEERRDAVMAHLADITQLGIDAAVETRKERISRTTTKARVVESLYEEITYLKGEALEKTMLMLEGYQTDTLEFLAERLQEADMSLIRNRLHSWLSYGGEQWRDTTGDKRDVIFRDFISLSDYFYAEAGVVMPILTEVYYALDISPGTIHQIQEGHYRKGVGAVFLITANSRVRALLRKPSSDRAIPDVSVHMSSEMRNYLLEEPKRWESVHYFMRETKKTLPETAFDYYLSWAGTHRSLNAGVL